MSEQPRGASIAWCVVSTLLWPMAMWMTRVRAVDVSRESVSVYRGLRPWPRRYPRPPYDRVMRLPQAVYITKPQAITLVNPTASPMLSEAEARWVASELHRALDATALRTR